MKRLLESSKSSRLVTQKTKQSGLLMYLTAMPSSGPGHSLQKPTLHPWWWMKLSQYPAAPSRQGIRIVLAFRLTLSSSLSLGDCLKKPQMTLQAFAVHAQPGTKAVGLYGFHHGCVARPVACGRVIDKPKKVLVQELKGLIPSVRPFLNCLSITDSKVVFTCPQALFAKKEQFGQSRLDST